MLYFFFSNYLFYVIFFSLEDENIILRKIKISVIEYLFYKLINVVYRFYNKYFLNFLILLE